MAGWLNGALEHKVAEVAQPMSGPEPPAKVAKIAQPVSRPEPPARIAEVAQPVSEPEPAARIAEVARRASGPEPAAQASAVVTVLEVSPAVRPVTASALCIFVPAFSRRLSWEAR